MTRILTLCLFLFLTLHWFAAEGQNTQEQLRQMRSNVIETIDGKEFFIHNIRRGQTLYMISKAYGVDINEIIRENPGVKEGIKADEKLLVPVPSKVKKGIKEPSLPKTVPPDSSTTAIGIDTVMAPPVLLPCLIDSSTKKPVYNVALMLPLFLGDVASINTDNSQRNSPGTIRSFRFLPFYEGFRIALDSIELEGGNFRIHIYDVDKDTNKTKQLLKKPEIAQMDMIIGLVYHANFRIISEFARKKKIPLVNPISERSDIVRKNPYVYKTQPDKDVIEQSLCRYFNRRTDDGLFLVLKNGKFPDRRFPEKFRELCATESREIRLPESQSELFTMLSRDRENYLITWNTSTEFIAEFTRRLYELRNEYRITLFGLPEWHQVNGVEIDYLMALNTHFLSPGFIDYYDPFVDWFVRRYQEQFNMDPEPLAFQGFETAWYFLNALRRYGTGFDRCLSEMDIKQLFTRYRFKTNPGDGAENKSWTVYRIENYRLVPEFPD